uniref:Uncharacterized protein n=1 Tax=Panagrellus redivivus TaxID=6233 RepID=A0A7E4VN35_PANRE
MADSRKGGIFNSAKFSERVFKNLPEGVRRGVKRDLAFVTRRDPNANDDKWNKAVLPEPRPSASNAIYQSQRQVESFEPSPMSSVPVQPSRPTRCIGNDVSSIVQAQIAAKAAAIGNKRQFSTAREELENLRRSKTSFQASETPTMFKSPPRKKPCPDERKEPAFPVNRPASLIAKSILNGLPHLSLHNNDAMMYETAVNKIIKDAIKTKVRPSSRNRSVVQNSPISQLLNQTAPLSSTHSRFSNISIPPPIDDEEPSRDVTRYIQSNASMAETTADISMASVFDPFNQSTISVDSTLTRKILARNNTIHNNTPDNANTSKFSLSGMRRMLSNSSFGNTTVNETATKSDSNLSVLSNAHRNDSHSTVASASGSTSFLQPSNRTNTSFFTAPGARELEEEDEFLQFILNRTPSPSRGSGGGSSSNESIFIFDD